jgi:hypothetical protein
LPKSTCFLTKKEPFVWALLRLSHNEGKLSIHFSQPRRNADKYYSHPMFSQ